MSLEPDDLPPIDPDGTSPPPPATTTTPRRTPCPELASVSREELRDLVESVHHVVLGITKSTIRADEIVQDTFEALMTTRRWTGKQPLWKHVFGIAMSLLHHQHASKALQREATAHAVRVRCFMRRSSRSDAAPRSARIRRRETRGRRRLHSSERWVDVGRPVVP